MWNRVPGQTAADVNLDASPYGFKVTGDGAWDSDSSDAVDKPAFRSRELGVMDSNGHITECPSEDDAREYQAAHGGELVSRATITVGW